MTSEPIGHCDDLDLPKPPPLGDPTALAESHARFPLERLELEILETLRQMFPLEVTPRQVTAMVRAPHLDVRTILQALAVIGTIEHSSKGYYRHKPRVRAGVDHD